MNSTHFPTVLTHHTYSVLSPHLQSSPFLQCILMCPPSVSIISPSFSLRTPSLSSGCCPYVLTPFGLPSQTCVHELGPVSTLPMSPLTLMWLSREPRPRSVLPPHVFSHRDSVLLVFPSLVFCSLHGKSTTPSEWDSCLPRVLSSD